jgi:nicotinamidase-related amidase
MGRITQLPLPKHYDRANAYKFDYNVGKILELQQQAIEWRKAHQLHYVSRDAVKIHLLVVDAQFDFSFPDGKLYVRGRSSTGAMDDHERLAKFIYRYLHLITEITFTMDTHLPYQIFHPAAHLCEDGSHPAPMTIISADDYRRGKYRANPVMAYQLGMDPVWLHKQFLYYCEQLESSGKYKLTIWPYHCLLGSAGHRLVGVMEEARLFHSFARGSANKLEIKGDNPLTEHYSIFEPEVMTLYNGQPIPHAAKNQNLLDTLYDSDITIITGQAKSHCLAWTIESFLSHIFTKDKTLARKVYILEDCSSPIVVPGVADYSDIADQAFQRFAEHGMNLVKSTDPIESWPGAEAKLKAI